MKSTAMRSVLVFSFLHIYLQCTYCLSFSIRLTRKCTQPLLSRKPKNIPPADRLRLSLLITTHTYVCTAHRCNYFLTVMYHFNACKWTHKKKKQLTGSFLTVLSVKKGKYRDKLSLSNFLLSLVELSSLESLHHLCAVISECGQCVIYKATHSQSCNWKKIQPSVSKVIKN